MFWMKEGLHESRGGVGSRPAGLGKGGAGWTVGGWVKGWGGSGSSMP